jgi:hypothetical protein
MGLAGMDLAGTVRARMAVGMAIEATGLEDMVIKDMGNGATAESGRDQTKRPRSARPFHR